MLQHLGVLPAGTAGSYPAQQAAVLRGRQPGEPESTQRMQHFTDSPLEHGRDQTPAVTHT